MKISEIKRLQKALSNEGLYGGAIDGKRGDNTDKAIVAALTNRSALVPNGWQTWSNRRKAVAYLQLLCQEKNIDAGIVDGFYGPQTESASESLKQLDENGVLTRGFDDIIVKDVNPHHFPMEDFDLLNAYYGEACGVNMVQVECPWKLRLDWDLSTTTHSISIHEKLSESLAAVLEKVYDTYGIDGIKSHGLDRYGGSYNCRKKRGSTSAWSTHSWGIAIDWFPSKNGLRSDHMNASLAHTDLDPWWKIWEDEGWLSLGRKENRDWMHIQAAKR
jgi:hypothetical protein